MKKRASTLKATVGRLEQQLSVEDEHSARSTLAALDKNDRIKRETSAAKNNLETFMQVVRGEGILDNPAALALMTSEERELIEQTLSTVTEWYEDGDGSSDSCTKSQYVEQLSILKKATESVVTKLEATEKAKSTKPKESNKKPKKAKPSKPAKKTSTEGGDEESPQEPPQSSEGFLESEEL